MEVLVIFTSYLYWLSATETENDSVSYNWKPSFLSVDEFLYLMLEVRNTICPNSTED